ncbi:MFS transporter [Novosphingobium terrae]|uniref:MFS transporter n=1 Tax=Novosphingobium terrae TaxID=2726189 RepID=UPI00197F69F3|nr:MFS transporter [Novosphingobium terrae]
MSSRQVRLLFACAIGMALGYTTLGPVMFGQFAVGLTKSLNRSADEVGFAISSMSIVAVFAPPLAGWLIDRHGARRVILCSGLGMAVVFAGLSAVRTLIPVLVLYALLAAVGAGTSPVAYARTIIANFDRQLGTALGIGLASIGVATALLPIAAVKLMAMAGIAGGYWLLCLAAILGVAPAYFLLADDRPAMAERSRLTRASTSEVLGHAVTLPGCTMLFIALLLGIFTANVWGNAVPKLIAKGMSVQDAALTMVALSGAMTLTRLGAGFALDRLFAPLVGAVLLLPAVVAWIILAVSDSHWMLVCGMMAFGLGLGVEIDIFSYLTSKYFPREIYGTFYGLMFSMLGLGGALAQPTMVVARAVSGSAMAGEFTVAALVVVAIALLLTLPGYDRFERADADGIGHAA